MTKTILIALLTSAAAAAPAAAQSNATLPTTDEAGNAVVVTASRSGAGTEIRNLPASVTLLDAEALDRRQTRVVSDVLRDVPGLAVNRSGGPGSLTQVRVRGSEANHVLVLIDGIEASDPFQGEFDFGTLIADEAAKIEVLRGQQSSLYGSDAIGGVIQYITLTGREAPGVSLRAEGGSFGTFAGGARVAGFGDAIDYAVSGSMLRSDGTPTARGGARDIGATSANGTAKVTWTPGGGFTLTGVGRYAYTDAQSNQTGANPALPGFDVTVDTPGGRLTSTSIYGLARAELSLAGGRWSNALTAQFADLTREGYTTTGRNAGNDGRRYKGTFETSLRLGGDRVTSRVTGAVDWEREEFRNTTPGGFAFSGTRDTTNWGFVGQYELTVDDALSAGASVRHDANDRFDDATTWRAQAGYRLPFGLRVRGAYGTGVKNPGYYELFGFADGRYIGNPDLRPEKSKGWEAGADYDLAGGKASIGATYFDSRLENEIFTTFPAPDFIATPANRTTRSTQHGVEAFVSARPIEPIRFDLAYTYLRARENGVEEVRRPRHVASLNTTVTSPDRRFAGTLTVRYNGRMTDVAFTPSFASVRVPMQEYVLVNLNADYRLSDRFSLFGRVENLFDERYEEIFGTATSGTGVYGGVRARI